MSARWLVSARFDLAFFVAPAALSIVLLCLSPASLLARDDLPVWIWVALIPLIDVSHVYASLYRTYFDTEELARRRALYVAVPALVFVVGTILYAADAATFWRILAYAAVWHFVRQQYGFLALYRRRAGERGRWEGRLDGALLYLTTLYPLLYWHTHLPRRFVWFVEGDFLPVPFSKAATAAGWLYLLLAVAYGAKELSKGWRGDSISLGKSLVLLTTAATWYVGIVMFDSDYAFTLTNVVSHGVPYVALVWITLRGRWAGPGATSWLGWISRPRAIAAFVGLLIALAIAEEALWDLLVWSDHPAVFGGRNHILGFGDSPLLAFVVALLALPQATHYVLDGFIWRTGPANPDVRRLVLGISPGVSETTASPRARTARARGSPSRGPSRGAACS
jgi:hypothetical protein